MPSKTEDMSPSPKKDQLYETENKMEIDKSVYLKPT